MIVVDGRFAGCVTLRPDEDGRCLESFFLAAELQGAGIGSAVLRELLARTDAEGVTVRLNVLQGSAARRLYERHGFTLEREDPVDVFMVQPAARTRSVNKKKGPLPPLARWEGALLGALCGATRSDAQGLT